MGSICRFTVLKSYPTTMSNSQFPKTMKAITFSKTGEVDVIEKTERPFPEQGPGDIVVKVRAPIMRLPFWPRFYVPYLFFWRRLNMPVSISSTST